MLTNDFKSLDCRCATFGYDYPCLFIQLDNDVYDSFGLKIEY